MILTADYHTHTPYSHGKGTILENATRAAELGLLRIGITDHGFSHVAFGVKRKEIPAVVRECREAEERTGVRVLVGIESNIRGVSGACDLTEEDFEHFDLYLAGLHVVIHYERASDLKLGWGNVMRKKLGCKPSPSLVKATNEAYCNAVRRNPIDVITHLGFQCVCDPVEVAACCSDYGTYLEISGKKTHLTDDELADIAAKTEVRFVVNSDAHDVSRIGDVSLALEQIARVGIPASRIDNLDGRMPQFRFAEYKLRRG